MAAMETSADVAIRRLLDADEVDPVAWVAEVLGAGAGGGGAGGGGGAAGTAGTAAGGLGLPNEPNDAAVQALDQIASAWVLRLQKISLEIGQRLDEVTAEAVGNIPRVLTDIELLKRDALAMREALTEAQQSLDAGDGETDGALVALAELDRIKRRMEDSNRALLEAESWNKLSAEIEQTFAAGDLRAIADKLLEMTRSLQVFRNLPEYENHRDLLVRLQARFHATLSPQVAAAVTARDTARTAALYAIFRQTARVDEFDKLYVKARRPQLLKAWTELRGGGAGGGGAATATTTTGSGSAGNVAAGARVLGSVADVLVDFNDVVLTTVAKELAWLSPAFPDAPRWVASLVAETFSNLEPSVPARIAAGLAETKRTDDELLGVLFAFGQARTLAGRLERTLTGVPETDDAVRAVLQSYTPWMRDYGALERRLLLAQLQAINLRRLAIPDTVQNVAENLPRMMAIADAAPERAVQLGHLALLPACFDALDAYFDAVWERLRGVLQYLRKTAKLPDVVGAVPSPAAAARATPTPAPTPAPAYEQDWSTCQGAIAFLAVCADAAGRLDRLTTSVTDKDATRGIEAASDSRVGHLHVALAQQAAARGASATSSTPASPLTKARTGLLDLTARTQLFLFETLFDAVRAALEAMPTLPQWAGPASGSGGTAPALPGVTDVPTFSLAPSAYVTVVGEHLLTLPQQMEPYTETSALAFSLQTLPPQVASAATGTGAPDGSDLTELWIRSVGKAAMAALVDRTLRIPKLAEGGRQQLLTDLRYFRNVLSALDIPESDGYAQLVQALQDPLAEVHQRLGTIPAAEQAIAARIASLRALAASS